MVKRAVLAVLAAAGVGALAWAVGKPLEVVQSGPQNEIASLAEANEIRVLFSEPMVVLGRIPEPVTAPFFRVNPPIPGSFRWSGTRLLIFTPDHSDRLPYATTYTVTVDASAVSVDGNRLAGPHTFTFTTPTARLLRAEWYRKEGRYDTPAVLALRFNQPVDPRAVAAHVRLAYKPHEWRAPAFQKEVLARLAQVDPGSFVAFQKKVAQTLLAVNSSKPVPFAPAAEWDKKRFPASADLVVLETAEAPPPQAQVLMRLDAALPAVQGRATPGREQEFTFTMEPAFFVGSLHCASQCSVEFYNSVKFRGSVRLEDLYAKVTLADVTEPGAAKPVAQKPYAKSLDEQVDDEEESAYDSTAYGSAGRWGSEFSFNTLGYAMAPARDYLVTVDGSAKSRDGQTLGYTWLGRVENWHKSAFTSFGDPHGVWEKSSGNQLPFYARNLKDVREWVAPVAKEDLVRSTLAVEGFQWPAAYEEYGYLKRNPNPDAKLPPVAPKERDLHPQPDVIQNYGLDLSRALSPAGTGLVWTGLRNGMPIEKSVSVNAGSAEAVVSLVQVTNLGLSVKDSPLNTLVFVTTLDTGTPVEGAAVEIRTLENKVFWKGVTGKDGVALAPDTKLRREGGNDWEPQFVVVAEKGGDIGYAVSDWHEGIRHYDFGVRFSEEEAKPRLRGTVFPDRGVYKLGEEVHLKAVLRSDTPKGMALFKKGAAIEVTVEDSRGGEQDKRTLPLSEWGTADWVFALPREAPLGGYSVAAKVDGQGGEVRGSFLVAAYRKPDFRVDVNVGGVDDVAGATLKGVVTGRYLFGGAMSGRPVRWTYTKEELSTVPDAVAEKFPGERYAYLKESWTGEEYRQRGVEIAQKEGVLQADGTLALDLVTDAAAGVPYAYTLEGEVEDVSRQKIAGRASFPVHPAPWYLGLKRPGFFADAKTGVQSEVVAVSPRGEVTAGVSVKATLTQIQWVSVRRAEGGGMYGWECEVRKKEAWSKELRTGREPVALTGPLSEGGLYILSVTAADDKGRTTTTDTEFYAIGGGYTAWERYDHNRIDLIPEKKTYRPGETARILVKSPWERATALLTVEREGVRSYRPFTLTSTQQTLSVPLAEGDIPNVFVSVLLVKGRTGNTLEKDGSDPGKPSFRLGYVELKVENSRKRLAVEVGSDRQEYRPAEKARFSADVKDADGKPVVGEVTLWAVDYGVLSLTGYRTPDVLPTVWVPKGLQVMNVDSRQRIVSRRVLTPKGAEEGGGGGYDTGPGTQVRKDFRVLAHWVGSAVTDSKGHFETVASLPESLTTFRVMAVVNDKAHRFGWAQKEIRVSKPLLLTPAFPRFLALRDTALFGAVLHSLLKEPGSALVTMRSLDPSLLEVTGDGARSVEVAAQGSAEVRFAVAAKGVGNARILMTARMLGEEDAFEAVLPVKILATPEVVAAYGQAAPDAKETVELPGGVLPNVGGLHLELSSTAMVGLGEGARYLVDYPYGCAEQRSSCALALMLAADLGGAFKLPGIAPEELKKVTQATLKDLEQYQCGDGGFVYWKGDPCWWTSPYLTSWVLHVFQRGLAMGYTVSPGVMDKGYQYLEEALGREKPPNESFVPCYTAWQAFACKVLTEGGRTEDSHLERLYGYRDRMPVFGLCNLWDAYAAAHRTGPQTDDLARRLKNAILPEGGTSHVEELSDPYLLWFWNSNVRSTAIALGSTVRNGDDAALVPGMVRWMMKVRQKGRWGNTQENAWAMDSLVDYYKKYEKEVPDFTATVELGLKTLLTGTFQGRDTEVRSGDTSMGDLLGAVRTGDRLPLTFKRQGTGTLFYVARLTYAAAGLVKNPMDQGIYLTRSYAPLKGGPATNSYKAGDLVQVTLSFKLTKERRFVAVTDPLPAGFEPVESWFATTARDLVKSQDQDMEENQGWVEIWERGGFDHVERHDDRVLLFATRLSEGEHSFRYVVRATTAGTFRTESAHAEEMYEPEVFGRTATDIVEVKP